MILSFEIVNYRSFKNKTIFQMEATSAKCKAQNLVNVSIPNDELRLLKTSLIYGANASGKTTLIRGLYALCGEIAGTLGSQGGDNVFIYEPFALDSESANQPSTMKITYLVNGIKYDYSVKFNEVSFLEERLDYYPNSKSNMKLFSRLLEDDIAVPDYGNSLLAKDKPKIKAYKNKLLLSKFILDTPHDIITPAAKYLSSIGFANSYNSNMKDKLWKESVKLLESSDEYKKNLRKILSYVDLGIRNFELPEDRKFENISLIHSAKEPKHHNTIKMVGESLGTNVLFLLGPKILQSLETGSPLFIDEVDTSFHSFISGFIIKMFTSEKLNPKHAQLIIVTHDITLMNEDLLRRDQIWFTEKDENGISSLFTLSDFEDVRETTPFAKWYLASKFGAVPSISDVEELFDGQN